MPKQSERPSLTTTLEDRYRKQKVGSTFDVKDVLKQPDKSPEHGDRMVIDGNEYKYSVDDFQVKPLIGITEVLDAIDANITTSPRSKELSSYMNGFSNKKYKP